MQNKKLIITLICVLTTSLSACWGSSEQAATTPAPSVQPVATVDTLTENLSATTNAAASPTPPPLPTAIPTPTMLSIDEIYQKLKSSTVYIYDRWCINGNRDHLQHSWLCCNKRTCYSTCDQCTRLSGGIQNIACCQDYRHQLL